MEKNIVIIFLFFTSIITYSQNIISEALHHQIENVNTDNLIPVMITVKSEINLQEIKRGFNINNTPIKKRASILASMLQENAFKTQIEITHKSFL